MQDISAEERYQQTLDYLYSRLPMFSRIGAAAIKKDLTNTIALCEALGNPERKFRSIHIAGTNGKGSTSHMLAAILQQAGYKTGLYTSPHLVDFRERIRINGEMVSKEFITGFVEKHRDAIEAIEPSFFEITVAMAFAAFADAGVDIAVVETGLGGRLDSTNVIKPELSIITNISFDHTDLLGKTIPEIAAEKAGIIKQNVPVVVGEENPPAEEVIIKKAKAEHSRAKLAYKEWLVSATDNEFVAHRAGSAKSLQLVTDLKGSYQKSNIATVLTAVDALNDQGWNISEEAVVQALSAVKRLTGLRGRWDILKEKPFTVADVAHNPAGLKIVLADWAALKADTKHIVVGFVRDKDVPEALSLFPKDARFHFCAANIPRALPAPELAAIASSLGISGTIYPSVAAAIEGAQSEMAPADALLISGSFFIVGEAMLTPGLSAAH